MDFIQTISYLGSRINMHNYNFYKYIILNYKYIILFYMYDYKHSLLTISFDYTKVINVMYAYLNIKLLTYRLEKK